MVDTYITLYIQQSGETVIPCSLTLFQRTSRCILHVFLRHCYRNVRRRGDRIGIKDPRHRQEEDVESVHSYVPDLDDQLSTASSQRLGGQSQATTEDFTSPESSRPRSRGTGTRRAPKLRRVLHHVSPSHRSATHRSHTSVGDSQASAWDGVGPQHTVRCSTQQEHDLCMFVLGNMRQLHEGWKEGFRLTVQKSTLQYCGEKVGATPPHQQPPPPPHTLQPPFSSTPAPTATTSSAGVSGLYPPTYTATAVHTQSAYHPNPPTTIGGGVT